MINIVDELKQIRHYLFRLFV